MPYGLRAVKHTYAYNGSALIKVKSRRPESPVARPSGGHFDRRLMGLQSRQRRLAA
jgi:hypothetical protein